MKNVNNWSYALLLSAVLMPTTMAFAQQGPNVGPQGGGFQGGFGGPGGGFQGGGPGGGQFGGPQGPVSAVSTSLTTLTSVLTLTAAQQSDIQGIQQEYRQARQVLTPRPTQTAAFNQAPNRPAPIDAATRAKLKVLDAKYSSEIDAVLIPAQLKSLTTLLEQLKELQAAQISPQLFLPLNVTSDEFTQIASIESSAHDALKTEAVAAVSSGDYDELGQAIQDSHADINTKVVAILTPDQKVLVQSARGGGFGGPGQGQRGAFRDGGGFQGGPGGGFGGPGGGGPDNGGGQGGPGGGFGGPGGGPDNGGGQGGPGGNPPGGGF